LAALRLLRFLPIQFRTNPEPKRDMRKTIIALLAIATIQFSAHAITIAKWTFETSVPTTAGPISAEAGSGTGTAFHASAATVFSNPVGNGSAESWSANNWSVGDFFQFSIATAGYKDIMLGWDQTSSSTGPGEFKLAYQINGGGFADFYDYTVIPNQSGSPGLGAWSSGTAIAGYGFSVDLSTVTGLNDAASVDFRLIMRTTADSTPPGTVATTGASRVDNFTVSGTLLPPSVPDGGTTALLLALPLLGLWALRRLSTRPV
jgi:hypothetical protein